MVLASESLIEQAGAIREAEHLRGVAATLGHCAGNGGLRGHPVGGVFPCVIFSKGNPHVHLDWCFLAPNGDEFDGFVSYEDAYAAAQQWLEEREV